MHTNKEAIDRVRNGDRCETSTTIHGLIKPAADCDFFYRGCRWRTVACDDETDVIECQDCGKQRTVRCTFDDDFA